jgi:S1-C subfamily serine protease
MGIGEVGTAGMGDLRGFLLFAVVVGLTAIKPISGWAQDPFDSVGDKRWPALGNHLLRMVGFRPRVVWAANVSQNLRTPQEKERRYPVRVLLLLFLILVPLALSSAMPAHAQRTPPGCGHFGGLGPLPAFSEQNTKCAQSILSGRYYGYGERDYAQRYLSNYRRQISQAAGGAPSRSAGSDSGTHYCLTADSQIAYISGQPCSGNEVTREEYERRRRSALGAASLPDDRLCPLATTVLHGRRQWEAIREYSAYVREAQKRGLTCGTDSADTESYGLERAPQVPTPSPEFIRMVQALLNELGYDVGPIDGIMGEKTRDAIRRYQRQMDIPADGQASTELLARLGESYRSHVEEGRPRQAVDDKTDLETERHRRAIAEARLRVVEERLARLREDHSSASPGFTARNPDSTGTGFFINRSGELVSNYHVVKQCQHLAANLSNGMRVDVSIVAVSEQNDLALLRTNEPVGSVATFRLPNRPVQLGEEIIAFGYPLHGLLSTQGNLTAGNVTATTGLKDDIRFVQISAPVQPGNSGGPLVDRSGLVVGVVTGKANAIAIANVTGDIPQNINFAISASIVVAFLNAYGISFSSSNSELASGAIEIAKLARSFSALILCWK